MEVQNYLEEAKIQLAPATIQDVQSSWRHIQLSGFEHLGHLIFSYWLLDQPRALDKYCVYYHGTKKAAIQLLPRFRRLGEIYAKRLDVWISTLDDPVRLFLLLYEHGYSHAKKGVTEKCFLEMQPSLLDALATALGTKMTFKIFDQWKAFFEGIFIQIFEGIRGFKEEEVALTRRSTVRHLKPEIRE